MALYHEEDRKRYHGIGTALIGKKLAEDTGLADPSKLFYTGLIHDLGGVGLKHHIVHIALADKDQRQSFSSSEMNQAQKHGPMGAKKLKDYGGFDWAIPIMRDHHERYDGSGYPKRLTGEEIPLSARISTISDVYDALTSVRPYKEAWSHERAVEEILTQKGTQFDPVLIELFEEVEGDFQKVKVALPDGGMVN